MDTSENKTVAQDGCQQINTTKEVPILETDKQVQNAPPGGEAVAKKKKTRRGKSKRKLNKPYTKVAWYQRRNPIGKKTNRNRKTISQSNLHAPYNTNQFLMEVHMPEAEGVFQMPRTPGRTRDSSFSVDSEDNYFYSLPEDEEDFLTKEFSSVYEDAQSERLASMTKEELVEENVVLEAKVEALTKRIINYRSVKTETDVSMSTTNSECDFTRMIEDLNAKLKEQEDKIRELQSSNETLKLQNELLKKRPCSSSSSEDSESDSSSSSSSSSSQGDETRCDGATIENITINGHAVSPEPPEVLLNGHIDNGDSISNPVLFNGNCETENQSDLSNMN